MALVLTAIQSGMNDDCYPESDARVLRLGSVALRWRRVNKVALNKCSSSSSHRQGAYIAPATVHLEVIRRTL